MMFQYPWLLLLSIPLLWFVWKQVSLSLPIRSLRLLTVVVVLLGISNPSCTVPTTDQDIVVVVDRSDSMPSTIEQSTMETIQQLQQGLSPNDGFAVLSVATESQIDKPLTNDPFQGFQPLLQTEQSNIKSGLGYALQLLSSSPKGKVVLISDGAGTDGELTSIQTQALTKNIPIYTLAKTQIRSADIHISNIQAPTHVNEGEQASIAVSIQSPVDQDAYITLYKDDQPIAQGQKLLTKGRNSVQFNDMPTGGGVHTYRVKVDVQNDDTPKNNTAEVGVLTKGRKKVLVLSQGPSVITETLRSAGLLVKENTPQEILLSPATLSQFQALVLHNVPATSFQEQELKNISLAIEQLGLGLWMIGGEQSFGVGGYLHSRLEDVLPVHLEIRNDMRKMGMALGIALDRSGSMSVSVGPNLTKMSLANQGTVAAIGLLTAMDSVYVAAVDTSNHEIIPFQDVLNPTTLHSKVMGIESMGGGIYVSTALEAQLDILKDAKQRNRHVVLFADAADAVDEKDSRAIVTALRENNTTLSVIALGTAADSDAGFLADLARIGGGSIYFSQNPKELPQLFSMDTMIASQSGYIVEPTEVQTVLGLSPLGGQSVSTMPTIEAYNISYAKSQTQLGAQNTDEQASPILVYGRYGLGQSVAYLGDIGGENGQQILSWSNFDTFVTTIVSGISNTETADITYAEVTRSGQKHQLTIESSNETPEVHILSKTGETERLDFTQIQPGLYQADYTPKSTGVYLPQLKTEKGVSTLPPMSHITSLEYSTQNTHNNKETLVTLSQRSGGLFNPTIEQILTQNDIHSHRIPLEYLWLWLTLCLLLLEISERKLRWLQRIVASILLRKQSRVHEGLQTTARTISSKDSIVQPKLNPQTRDTEDANQRDASSSQETKKRKNTLQEALKRAKKDQS